MSRFGSSAVLDEYEGELCTRLAKIQRIVRQPDFARGDWMFNEERPSTKGRLWRHCALETEILRARFSQAPEFGLAELDPQIKAQVEHALGDLDLTFLHARPPELATSAGLGATPYVTIQLALKVLRPRLSVPGGRAKRLC